MKLLSLLSAGTIALAGLLSFAGVARADINDKEFESAMDKYLSSDKGQDKLIQTLEVVSKKRQEDARKKQDELATAQLEAQFKNPVKIDIGSSPVKGPDSAKVTIIEFSDFQCPYCKRGADTMTEVLKAYPTQVKVVFKNLPLPFHPQAEPSARAAYAAGKQGKFWEYHDALFANQGQLSDEFYTATAKKLALDMTKFKADMDSPEAKAAVKADAEIGEKNGIQGTPGFFVNGVAVKGAYPVDYFKKIIDRHLAGGANEPKKG